MNVECRQCKLCSAKSSLISLFRGKNKLIRNYIRKIVEITTSIECEENDYFQCICYYCVGFTFNMYIFRTRSLENVKKLKTKSSSITRKKIGIKRLEDIELADLDQLRVIFTKWMQDKKETYSSDTTSSKDTDSRRDIDSQCAVVYADVGVQSDPPAQNFASSKDFRKVLVSTVGTQTENEYFQYKQNNDDSINGRLEEFKYDYPCELNRDDKYNSGIQIPNKKPKQSDVRNKRNNGCSNYEELEKLQCMENAVAVSDRQGDHNNVNESDQTINVKTPFIELSPIMKCSPSPYECNETLQMSDVGISFKTNPLSSTTYSTPCSSGLLEITEKATMLYSCEECDLVMYYKEEVKKHKRNHTQCHICHKRFRSIQQTKQHFEKCKQTPYISLERYKDPTEKKQNCTPQKKKRKTAPSEERKRSPKKKK